MNPGTSCADADGHGAGGEIEQVMGMKRTKKKLMMFSGDEGLFRKFTKWRRPRGRGRGRRSGKSVSNDEDGDETLLISRRTKRRYSQRGATSRWRRVCDTKRG